jgi:hypothetical protein
MCVCVCVVLTCAQICDSFRCEPQVYSCAVTTLDRFLATGRLMRHEEVGVYAAASIFVACKHSGKYMKAHSLVRFTGNFFSEEQLKVCSLSLSLHLLCGPSCGSAERGAPTAQSLLCEAPFPLLCFGLLPHRAIECKNHFKSLFFCLTPNEHHSSCPVFPGCFTCLSLCTCAYDRPER